MIKISGIQYVEVSRKTIEEMRGETPNLAAHLEKNGFVALVTLKRPHGKRPYGAYETKRGTFVMLDI